MDIAELEENTFAACDAKLHGGMCKTLSAIYCKVLLIFPSLEDARPRSKSGIQALCSLHIALEKTKIVLQHCSESSKLYLAITGDSVLLKFEKARTGLKDSLTLVEDIVPQSIGCQIEELVSELEGATFLLDPSEKKIGEEIIALLQQGKKIDNSIELEPFHQAATKLGITSSRAALTERRALKKLIKKARFEEDKRKEAIVTFLLHLMKKYSKLFKPEFLDENDSQASTPCSPTERHFSRPCQIAIPPEELRCPISLQLMYDPVIISSGQTYERICIEKWLSDGHNTCPKTQQQLSHDVLTPNYCVKGLIISWCEQNGLPAPNSPPESPDLNESTVSTKSGKARGIKVVPLDESCVTEMSEEFEEESEVNAVKRYDNYLSILNGDGSLKRKCRVVERIRVLLKDDDDARIDMGDLGFVDVLLRLLKDGEGDSGAQDGVAMALFNLAVNNDRNKQAMLSGGVIPVLEQMISNTSVHGSATALYSNLSSLDEAKPVIASAQAVTFLVNQLKPETDPLRKLDSLDALYNLSTHPPNVPELLSAGIVTALQCVLSPSPEKSISLIMNLAITELGKVEIGSNSSIVSDLASILDSDESGEMEQESAVACLLMICDGNEKCCEMVLREGVIPGLVAASVKGTARGREKAVELLMVFREQRRREQQGQTGIEPVEAGLGVNRGSKPGGIGKALSFLWRSKSYSSVKSCS